MGGNVQVFLRELDIKELISEEGYELKDIIKDLIKIGYRGIQFAERLKQRINRHYRKGEISFIHDLAKSKKIEISYHHNQNNTNLARDNKKYLEMAKKSIDKAASFGASYIVFHLGFIHFNKGKYESEIKKARSILVRNLSYLIDYTNKKNIVVTVENNRPSEEKRRMDCDIEDIKFIVEGLRKRNKELKITFDTGHAFNQETFNVKNKSLMYEGAKKYVSEFIDEFFGNIYAVHFHDNSLSYDDHMIPGDGLGPVSLIIQKLREKGYEKDFLLELHIERWREKYKDKNILEIYEIAYDRLLNMLSNKGFF